MLDPRNRILAAIERVAPGQLALLRYVDPYGDTVFNKLQMPDLLADLGLVAEAADEEGAVLLSEVAEIARRCRDGMHEYLWFVGD